MIAQVIGIDDVITVTPTLDTNAYASGDRLGSIHTITNAFRNLNRDFDPVTATDSANQKKSGKCVLQSITVIDQAKQSQPFTIMFFSSSPTVASADNAAIDISDAEMIAKCIGVVSFDATYLALAGNSVATKTNIGLILKQSTSAANQHLYAVVVIGGAATYAASSLQFQYGFYQD